MFYRRRLEGAYKAETRPFAEYDPLRMHPSEDGFVQDSDLLYADQRAPE